MTFPHPSLWGWFSLVLGTAFLFLGNTLLGLSLWSSVPSAPTEALGLGNVGLGLLLQCVTASQIVRTFDEGRHRPEVGTRRTPPTDGPLSNIPPGSARG